MNKDNLPITQQLFASAPPPVMKPISTSFFGRMLNERELEQRLRLAELQNRMVNQYVISQELNQEIMDNFLNGQAKIAAEGAKIKAKINIYESQSDIAMSAADVARIEARDKALNLSVKEERIERQRKNMRD